MKNSAGKAPVLIQGALAFSLLQSCFAFFLYLAGSVRNFTDDTLLLLLGASRFFGFSAFVFSLWALILSCMPLFRGRRGGRLPEAGFCLLGGLLGAGMFLLNSFIIAAAGGNA